MIPVLAAAFVTAALIANGPVASASSAAMPTLYKNCTNLNKKYRHGVGRVGASDKVRPGNPRVTNFTRNNRIFRIAMSWNKGLDRDKDLIACEKL